MRAIVVVLLLFVTPVSFADPGFDAHTFFGFNLTQNLDAHRKYEERYMNALGILYEQFQLHEGARLIVNFGCAEDDTRTYLVEVKFCMKGNPRVCLSERLSRSFSSGRNRPLLLDLYLASLSPETLTTMAKLAARDELVVVTSASIVTSPWFWPNQVVGQNIVNFNDLIRSVGQEATLPTKPDVQVKLRFETSREL